LGVVVVSRLFIEPHTTTSREDVDSFFCLSIRSAEISLNEQQKPKLDVELRLLSAFYAHSDVCEPAILVINLSSSFSRD
jgi:hypothetical protein